MSRSSPTLALGLAAALLAACTSGSGTQSPTPTPVATPTPGASPDVTEGPSGTPLQSDDPLGEFICNGSISGSATIGRALIVDVRVGTHDGYDRIVFEFVGETEPALPEFVVGPAEPPFYEEGSGFEIEVDGQSFVGITLRGGTRQSETGGSTYDGPTEFEPDHPALRHLVEGGDFEAQSVWYAGLATDQPCIRVITLQDPSRLVVDVQH